MGLTDSLKGALTQAKDKATEYARTHNSQIGAGLDKVGQMADKATKGKYHDQINTGTDKAKEAVTKFNEKPRTVPGETVDPGAAADTADAPGADGPRTPRDPQQP